VLASSAGRFTSGLDADLKLREQRPNPRRIGRKAVREYFLDCEARNLSEQTLWWYREKLGRFLQFLENQGVESVESITPSVIREFLHFAAWKSAKDGKPVESVRSHIGRV